MPAEANLAPQWFRPRASRVGGWLAAAILLVWTLGAVANFLIHYVIGDPDSDVVTFLNRFDLGHEPSIPAYFSGLLLLASAIVLTFLASTDQQPQRPFRLNWALLALVMLALSIDEVVMFHEMGDAMMRMTPLGDLLYFAWVIPGACVALGVALVNVRFLWRLPRRTSGLILLSGAVFVAGAIGMELVASAIFSAAADESAAQASLAHIASQAVEELLEMAGVAIFLFALLDYIEGTGLRVWLQYQKLDD